MPNILVGSVGGGTRPAEPGGGARADGAAGRRQGGGARRSGRGALPLRRDLDHGGHRRRAFHARARQAGAAAMNVAAPVARHPASGESLAGGCGSTRRSAFRWARRRCCSRCSRHPASASRRISPAGRCPASGRFAVAWLVVDHLLLPAARLRRIQGPRGRPALPAGAADPARAGQPAADRRRSPRPAASWRSRCSLDASTPLLLMPLVAGLGVARR